MSALLLHSQLNTWLQWVGQRQPQDKTRNVYAWGLGAPYIRELTVIYNPVAIEDSLWIKTHLPYIYIFLFVYGFTNVIYVAMLRWRHRSGSILSDCTKPIPEPTCMLTYQYYQLDPVTFIWGQFHKNNTSATSHYLFKILFNPMGQWFR